jgi:hypothetical protein
MKTFIIYGNSYHKSVEAEYYDTNNHYLNFRIEGELVLTIKPGYWSSVKEQEQKEDVEYFRYKFDLSNNESVEVELKSNFHSIWEGVEQAKFEDLFFIIESKSKNNNSYAIRAKDIVRITQINET